MENYFSACIQLLSSIKKQPEPAPNVPSRYSWAKAPRCLADHQQCANHRWRTSSLVQVTREMSAISNNRQVGADDLQSPFQPKPFKESSKWGKYTMQKFWFNYGMEKGVEKTKTLLAWTVEHHFNKTTLSSLESRRVNNLLFISLFSTVKPVPPAPDSKGILISDCDMLKFQIRGREGSGEAFFYWSAMMCWTGEKPMCLN